MRGPRTTTQLLAGHAGLRARDVGLAVLDKATRRSQVMLSGWSDGCRVESAYVELGSGPVDRLRQKLLAPARMHRAPLVAGQCVGWLQVGGGDALSQ